VTAPTARQALNVVHDRLLMLGAVEAALGASFERGEPSFGRWLEGTIAALREAGLRNEADRVLAAARRETILATAIARARGTLESLVDQIRADPYAIGLRADDVPSQPSPRTLRPMKRVAWPWLPLVFALGLYGRPAIDSGARRIVTTLYAAQLRLQELLARAVDALTPGPAEPVPTWLTAVAFWLLIGSLVVFGGILIDLLAAVIRQHGVAALWRSRRYRIQLFIAVVLAASVAALSR
jgi:hypothetical protein